MSVDRVRSGRDVPNDCNAIVEIPMNADRIFRKARKKAKF